MFVLLDQRGGRVVLFKAADRFCWMREVCGFNALVAAGLQEPWSEVAMFANRSSAIIRGDTVRKQELCRLILALQYQDFTDRNCSSHCWSHSLSWHIISNLFKAMNFNGQRHCMFTNHTKESGSIEALADWLSHLGGSKI